MIDLRELRDNPDLFRDSQRKRGEDVSLVGDALQADAAHRKALAEFERLRAEQKAFGKEVAQAKGEEKAALVAQAKDLAAEVKAASSAAEQAEALAADLTGRISNLVLPEVPEGGEEDFETVRTVGTPRDFAAEGFAPVDHLDLMEGLSALDMARGAKVGGARFYFLTGIGFRLELALMTMALDQALANGFTPMGTPTLVKPEVMRGTGFLVQHSDEIYHLGTDDLYLTGTSEVALAGYREGEILDLSAGPERLLGWSTCYRREAGSYGKDTRGIVRVHQFQKAEMFVYCHQEDAAAEHERLLAWEEQMLQKVELPYRVINIAGGDLGSSAARKFDCEAWVPTQGTYREMTSTSNCTTYQARRLNIRERTEKGTRPVATLNGTLATTRWIVAILENHQQPDGSVVVPAALRPYLGGLEVLTPTAALELAPSAEGGQ